MIPYGRLVAAGVVAAALTATHWKAYTVGRNGEQVKAAELAQAQILELANFNETQRLLERSWQTQITKAQNERVAKAQAGQAIRNSVAGELDRLRSAIYALDTNASGEPATACKIAAIAARSVFEQCVKRYTEVARAADGHDADTLMLEQSWPK